MNQTELDIWDADPAFLVIPLVDLQKHLTMLQNPGIFILLHRSDSAEKTVLINGTESLIRGIQKELIFLSTREVQPTHVACEIEEPIQTSKLSAAVAKRAVRMMELKALHLPIYRVD